MEKVYKSSNMPQKDYKYTTLTKVRRVMNVWKAVWLMVVIVLVISSVVAAVIIFAVTSPPPPNAAFDEFIAKYGKKYSSKDEYYQKRKAFEENVRRINRFNIENHSHKLEINEFADLTDDEFSQLFSLKPLQPVAGKHSSKTTEPFEEIDWEKEGYIAQMHSQESYSTSWALPIVSAIESLYALTHNKSFATFSEQELVDCASKDPCKAFQYVKEHGISLLQDYPLHNKDTTCKNTTSAFYLQKGCVKVDQNSAAAMARALKKRPLIIYVTSGAYAFRFYKSGIIAQGCEAEPGHYVNLVGTGVDKTTGLKYWKIRNFWGDQKYVKIVREDEKEHGMCGVTMSPIYPE